MTGGNGVLGTALIVLYILGYASIWLLVLGIILVLMSNLSEASSARQHSQIIQMLHKIATKKTY